MIKSGIVNLLSKTWGRT